MKNQYSPHVVSCVVPPLSQWIRIVSSITGTKVTVRNVSEGDYRRAHGRLLRACDECSEDDAICRKLSALVRPWVSSETLRKADKKIVVDLLSRIKSVESQLTGRNPVSKRTKRLLLITAMAVVGAALAGFAWSTWDEWQNWSSIAGIRGRFYRFVRYVRASSFAARIGFLACVVIAFGTLLLRGTRKY